MAAVTLGVITADTTTGPNTSGAFTPALNDLLIVFFAARQTADTGAQLTCVSSVGGFTFTKLSTEGFFPTTPDNRLSVYVADALVSSATSQTVTVDTAVDVMSGSIIAVALVAGMTKTGLAAILQSAVDDDNSGGATPATVFGASALTGNATIGYVMNSSSPAAMTEPTGWTEIGETDHITPNHGGELVSRDSGFTGTTITWGSTYGSAGCAISIELDTSTAGTTISPNPAGMSV
jgi:hypothetical protein